MRVIPGSYGLGRLPHEMTFDKDSLLRRGQRITVPVEESRAVELVLAPGEMSLLVRGTDRFGHFAPEPRPTADLDPAARAAYRIALDRMGVRRAR